MALYTLLRVLRRTWPILVLGMLVTGFAGYQVRSASGVYWAQVDVVFLPPLSAQRQNPLGQSASGLVRFASVIERDVNGADRPPHVVSPRVTIVDEGVRRGHQVRLPNDGGQWTYSFTRPVLDVQVADSSPEAVSARMDALLAQIQQAIDTRQKGVRAAQLVTTAQSPARVDVHYSQGRASRALLMTLIVGGLLTLGAVDWWDRRGPHRATARHERPAPAVAALRSWAAAR